MPNDTKQSIIDEISNAAGRMKAVRERAAIIKQTIALGEPEATLQTNITLESGLIIGGQNERTNSTV